MPKLLRVCCCDSIILRELSVSLVQERHFNNDSWSVVLLGHKMYILVKGQNVAQTEFYIQITPRSSLNFS